MLTTNRLRFVASIVLAVAAIGCDKATPFDGETPVIVGTITSREPYSGSPAMFVVADGATSDQCYPHGALFWLEDVVVVLHNGFLKDTSDLRVGRHVSVFAPLPATKNCLPISQARGVVLE